MSAAKASTPVKRYILYAVLILALAGGYLLMFAEMSLPALPFGGDVEAIEQQVALADIALINQQKLHRQRVQELMAARELARFVYPADTDPNRIVTQIEKLAYDSGLTYSSLRRIGGRSSDNDYLRIEEVTINGQVDIKQLAMFLKAVENNRPLLQWSMFNITPRPNQPSPNVVYMSGRLQAWVLTPEAAVVLAGDRIQ